MDYWIKRKNAETRQRFLHFKFVVIARYQLIGAVRFGESSQGAGWFQGIVLPASALRLSSGDEQPDNNKIRKAIDKASPIIFFMPAVEDSGKKLIFNDIAFFNRIIFIY